ncbi:MAG: hypothetical protein Q9226_008535, partial [Calogaya cf. arnoldii]
MDEVRAISDAYSIQNPKIAFNNQTRLFGIVEKQSVSDKSLNINMISEIPGMESAIYWTANGLAVLAVCLLHQNSPYDQYDAEQSLDFWSIAIHRGNFAADILRALIELDQYPPEIVAALVSLHCDYSSTVGFVDNTYDWPWSP